MGVIGASDPADAAPAGSGPIGASSSSDEAQYDSSSASGALPPPFHDAPPSLLRDRQMRENCARTHMGPGEETVVEADAGAVGAGALFCSQRTTS